MNNIDLWRNVVKSKISKIQGQGQTWDQTRQTYVSSFPINNTASYILPTVQQQQQVYESQPSQFQSNYRPQETKNAYSFNYQRVAQA